MRVRINESTLLDDLVRFLRRCGCRVTQVELETIDVQLDIDVSLEVAMTLVRAGRCYRCGEEVAPGLSALGSTLCHDCRDRSEHENGAHMHDQPSRVWARMEIDAYLSVWCALHPEAHISISNAPRRARQPSGRRLGALHSKDARAGNAVASSFAT
jgi:hypothetical protein